MKATFGEYTGGEGSLMGIRGEEKRGKMGGKGGGVGDKTRKGTFPYCSSIVPPFPPNFPCAPPPMSPIFPQRFWTNG